MRRPVLLALMSTATFAVASAMLAFGLAVAIPFEKILTPDLLIQLPVPFTVLALVTGAAVVDRFARRTRVARASAIAATLLGVACLFFGAYLAFDLHFWPAFAENRVDLGFTLRHGGKWVVAAWVVYLLVALAVAIPMSRRPTTPSRAPRFALVGIAIVTCIATIFAARRIGAQPRGYLASLSSVHLDANGPPSTQVDSLCIWRSELPIARNADGRVKLYRCASGIAFDKTCEIPLTNPDMFGPLTDDVERGVSVMQLRRGAPCPTEPTPAATARDFGTTLLFDAKHDVFFEPSKYHRSESGYFSQLPSREHDIVTLRDVGAPAPRILFYCAIFALVLAVMLEIERSRGREPSASSVVMVAAFALPLVVATIAS